MAKQSFEQMLLELDEIVQQLETGSSDLELSLKQYEKGVALLRSCRQTLTRVQRKIEVLTEVDPEGIAETTNLEDSELTDQQKAQARSSRRGYKTDADAAPSASDSEPKADDAPSPFDPNPLQENTLF